MLQCLVTVSVMVKRHCSSNSHSKRANSGPEAIHLWNPAEFSVRLTAPPEPLGMELFCSWVWSIGMLENALRVFATTQCFCRSSLTPCGKDFMSLVWTGALFHAFWSKAWNHGSRASSVSTYTGKLPSRWDLIKISLRISNRRTISQKWKVGLCHSYFSSTVRKLPLYKQDQKSEEKPLFVVFAKQRLLFGVHVFFLPSGLPLRMNQLYPRKQFQLPSTILFSLKIPRATAFTPKSHLKMKPSKHYHVLAFSLNQRPHYGWSNAVTGICPGFRCSFAFRCMSIPCLTIAREVPLSLNKGNSRETIGVVVCCLFSRDPW